MSNKKFQSILNEALEEEIPSSEIDLWPAVKTNLEARENQQTKKGNMMNSQNTSRMPRFSLAVAGVLALLITFAATPQGRAFAQNLLNLFTPAESTTFELDDPQIIAEEHAPNAPTAAPPTPLISAADAQAQVGFDLAELSFLPEGLEYLGARMYGSHVALEYQTTDKAGHLIITQSQAGFYESDWDSVPTGAIVPVKIGDLDGEFIQGTFVVYAGETNATWEPDAPIMKLRWQENGISYEISRYGSAKAIEYLDMAKMIAMAVDLAN